MFKNMGINALEVGGTNIFIQDIEDYIDVNGFPVLVMGKCIFH